MVVPFKQFRRGRRSVENSSHFLRFSASAPASPALIFYLLPFAQFRPLRGLGLNSSSFAVEDYQNRGYMIYDADCQLVSEEIFADCRAVLDARRDHVDLYQAAKENGINVYGFVDGNAITVVPLEYCKVEYLSPRWQYGIYVEKSDPSVADYKTNDGASFAVSYYDFYYNGRKVLTLGRDDFDGVNYYASAYGDFILIRDCERTIHAYDKTGAVSYEGTIESMSEYEGWSPYTHVPTGQSAFTKGCTLTAEEVKQDLMPDNGLYYDLQGNLFPLENYYSSVNRFNGAYAVVERQGKSGLIDRSGKEIVPCEFDRSYGSDWPSQMEDCGYVVATVNGKVCFVNSRGEITYQSPYDESVVKGYRGVFRYLQDLTGEYILLTPEGGVVERRFAEQPELFEGAAVCAVSEADGSVSLIDYSGDTVLNTPKENKYLSVYMTGSGELFFLYSGNRRYSVYCILRRPAAADAELNGRDAVCQRPAGLRY